MDLGWLGSLATGAVGLARGLFGLRKDVAELRERPSEPPPDIRFWHGGITPDGFHLRTAVRNPTDRTIRLTAVTIEEPPAVLFFASNERTIRIGESGWIPPGEEKEHEHQVIGLPRWKGGEVCFMFQIAPEAGVEPRPHRFRLTIGSSYT